MNPLSCLLSAGLHCLSPEGLLAGPAIDAMLLAQAPSAAPDFRPAWRPEKPSEVLTFVQTFYDGTKDLRAGFTQTYHDPSFGSTTVTKGRLEIKKPGKMIWDYAGEDDQDIYADGKELWVVEHDTRQVVRMDVGANSDVAAAMQFLFGGQKLVREFKVRYANDARARKYGDTWHHVVELKPKLKNPHYKGIVLVVQSISGRVDSFVVYNQNGSTNYFVLDHIETNVGLRDGRFTFQLPAGYVESRE